MIFLCWTFLDLSFLCAHFWVLDNCIKDLVQLFRLFCFMTFNILFSLIFWEIVLFVKSKIKFVPLFYLIEILCGDFFYFLYLFRDTDKTNCGF